MIPSRQKPVDTMNRLLCSLRANLHEFVVVRDFRFEHWWAEPLWEQDMGLDPNRPDHLPLVYRSVGRAQQHYPSVGLQGNPRHTIFVVDPHPNKSGLFRWRTTRSYTDTRFRAVF